MKTKICALFLTVIANAAFGQPPLENTSNNQKLTTNTDGTTTVKKLNENGDAVALTLIAPDGTTKRQTRMTFNKEGKCLGWKSLNEKGTLDCGQIYTYHTSGDLLEMRSLAGDLIYRK